MAAKKEAEPTATTALGAPAEATSAAAATVVHVVEGEPTKADKPVSPEQYRASRLRRENSYDAQRIFIQAEEDRDPEIAPLSPAAQRAAQRADAAQRAAHRADN